MQPFKALLVALVVGGSAAASAADHTQSSTVEPKLERAPLSAQSWPAIREVENAWPQWMYSLTGTVLALHDERPQTDILVPATHTGTHQQPDGSPQVRPAGLPWHVGPDAQMPQRLSF